MHSNLFAEGIKTKGCPNPNKIVIFFFKIFVDMISFLRTPDHSWALNKVLVSPS